MKRISLDYIADSEAKCKVCGRRILPGMYIFAVGLRGGKRGLAHSACEQKIKVTKK